MTALNRSDTRWAVLFVLLIALCAGAYEGWLAAGNPFLGDDSGYRVYFAHRPVVKIGNRVWLPFLQVQIWFYHLLGLPFAGVKLISVFYFTLATACVGLYWRVILGSGLWPGVLSILAAAGFAAHRLCVTTGPLMQEEVGAGLFFAFALLTASRPTFSAAALIVGAAALMTRDSYWIYLFAATVVGLWRAPWTSRRLAGYAALWSIPSAWLLVCIPAIYIAAYGRLPAMPIEWPLMYNPVPPAALQMSSAESLWLGLSRSGALPLAAAVALSALALWVWKRRSFLQEFEYSEFAATAIRAAPIAAGVVYGLVWLLDPWQVTPGNTRAAWPLLEIGFVAAPLLIRAAYPAPAGLRPLVIAAVAVGLAAGIHPQPLRKPAESSASAWAELHRLKQAVGGQNANVCIQASDRWPVFRDLSAALFHERKTLLQAHESLPLDCRFTVIEDGIGIAAADGFQQATSISLPERRWILYRRADR